MWVLIYDEISHVFEFRLQQFCKNSFTNENTDDKNGKIYTIIITVSRRFDCVIIVSYRPTSYMYIFIYSLWNKNKF